MPAETHRTNINIDGPNVYPYEPFSSGIAAKPRLQTTRCIELVHPSRSRGTGVDCGLAEARYFEGRLGAGKWPTRHFPAPFHCSSMMQPTLLRPVQSIAPSGSLNCTFALGGAALPRAIRRSSTHYWCPRPTTRRRTRSSYRDGRYLVSTRRGKGNILPIPPC